MTPRDGGASSARDRWNIGRNAVEGGGGEQGEARRLSLDLLGMTLTSKLSMR